MINSLIPINKEMPLREAALLGCAIPTGAGIVINNAKIKTGDSVAIFGVGGIGLSSVIAAMAVGAGMIIAVDIIDSKLELAKKLGATHTVNSAIKNPITEILNITEGKGVDYAIEAAGIKMTMEMAFQSVSYNGGKCIIAGNLANGEMISIDPMDLIKGKNIIGTWGGGTNPDNDIPKYVDWYTSSKNKFNQLITNVYKLKDINLSFEDLNKGIMGRSLINMDIVDKG
jgi:S-(hydroxymethyl)glutathione dehydrogenase/alcohol dehydrogenase